MIRLSLNARVKHKIAEYLKEQHIIAANAQPGNVPRLLKAHGFTNASSIFVRWLDSREEKMGIRIPTSTDIARLLFYADNNVNQQCVFLFDVEVLPATQATLWRQEKEIEITCELDLDRGGELSPREMSVIHDGLLPEALQRLSQVEKRIKLGETYLKYAIEDAEAQSFSFPILKSTTAQGNQLIITLDAFALDEQKQENSYKIKTCQTERGTIAIVDSNSVAKKRQKRGERKTICRGTIQQFDEKRWTLILNIEKYSANIDPDRLDIPSHALIEYSALGDLTTQKDAIRRLKSGEERLAVLPLDLLLYGENGELLDSMAPLPETKIRPLHDFLQNKMNEQQKQAVELALAVPDFFLLQGPPGTGKTTFISELCYQLVLQGKKVLVSSQSNLAVDNALSRLAENPKILAIRLGAEEKVQEIGADFVGDRAVLRWIRSISRRITSKT